MDGLVGWRSALFAGMVVVGWLGRASKTLHHTHHVSHADSRDTAVSSFFLFLRSFFFLISNVTLG